MLFAVVEVIIGIGVSPVSYNDNIIINNIHKLSQHLHIS